MKQLPSFEEIILDAYIKTVRCQHTHIRRTAGKQLQKGAREIITTSIIEHVYYNNIVIIDMRLTQFCESNRLIGSETARLVNMESLENVKSMSKSTSGV